MHFSRARLRGHRDGLGLTVGELADRVGMTPPDYARIEAGDWDIHVLDPLVSELAYALGVSAHELVSLGGTWADDYADAAIQHLGPMSTEEVARAARALAPHAERRAS